MSDLTAHFGSETCKKKSVSVKFKINEWEGNALKKNVWKLIFSTQSDPCTKKYFQVPQFIKVK